MQLRSSLTDKIWMNTWEQLISRAVKGVWRKKWKFDYFMIFSPYFDSLDSIFQGCVFYFLFSVGYINSLEEFGLDCSEAEQSSAQTLAII